MKTEYQYKETIKKGNTVIYGNKPYRVQDDGKGFLHIIIFENGKRKKIGIDKMNLFEYGTEADYIFNEWWMLYPDYITFQQFAAAEKAWQTI